MEKKLFSLDGVEQTAQSIMEYVIDCMKQCKLSSIEMEEYTNDVKSKRLSDLITTSNEYLNMLNTMKDVSKQPEVKVSYLW